MLYDDVEEPGDTSPARLRGEYVAELRAVVDSRGVDAVADESGVDHETVAALVADADVGGDAGTEADADPGTIQLSDAAAILATDPDAPAGEDILLEVRDHLLMGMTTAVLDVDTLAAEIDADLDAKQVHQKVEGRTPMTLDEYARLQHFIASRQR
ncbi:DUF5791 family protein [Halorussus halobius]|uniref:DUF5791 family protein n=1 Tax=Halorussus halobius TaxID=1710537 RepID=UPI001091FC81|nr:DUF5791 family protein [Halorussus halobius]